jgi:hypothetical protein
MLNISNKNNEPTTKTKGKFLVYCLPVSIISVNEILIIIITNKNNTVIAPTYTIIYDKPRNPIPDKIKYPAAFTNTEIKYTTDITGFLEVITNILDIMVVKLNIFINTNFILTLILAF